MTRIGMIGTGFIARGAMGVIDVTDRLEISKVLTRRPLDTVDGFDPDKLTQSANEVIDSCDIVFDATGDPIHSTLVVEAALRAGRKVVTMHSELHITTGSYLANLGYLTEADGDQPGAIALLDREARSMGFTPVAYVNIKGFLDPNPTRENMEYWSKRQNLSLAETTSFTDGTKLQVEQAFCANAFGGTIARSGMIGGTVASLHDTDYLVEQARELGQPVSDYVLSPGAPPGVFVLAEHPVSETLPHYSPYEKLMTTGRQAYLLLRPYHLCALEVAKSLTAVADGAPPLMTNGPVPRVSVAAVAKHALDVDHIVHHPIGSFELRGQAVLSAEQPDHVPLGLLAGARIKRHVAEGETITFDHVEMPESRALSIWLDELRPLFHFPEPRRKCS
jgi:predicted homoserine dehydrogenase-like protein